MEKTPTTETPKGLDRRKALAKLGLTAAIAYAAPVVVGLERRADAQLPTPCHPRGGGRLCPPGHRGGGFGNDDDDGGGGDDDDDGGDDDDDGGDDDDD